MKKFKEAYRICEEKFKLHRKRISMKRVICLVMLIVLTISGNINVAATEIQIGTDVYNLVTTFVGDAGTTRGFAWSAETDYANMVIRYAKEDEWSSAITESADYTEYEGRFYYKAELKGLEVGETYIYKIGDTQKDAWSKAYKFTTEPDNLTEFSFIGVTDPQSSTATDFEYYTQTLTKAIADRPDLAFMVNLGDMVNESYKQNEWDLYFQAAGDIIKSIPHMAAVGNHETRGKRDASGNIIDITEPGKHFSLQFNNPDNGENALGDLKASDVFNGCTKGVITNIKESVYSFDYGNTHFAVLNSGTDWNESDKKKIMTEQAKWLRDDLNASDKKWKIVMVHIGLYPAKIERYTTRPELLEVIDECGVDLVLSGHDHMIARTYPMYNNDIISTLNTTDVIKNGTVYNILGSAGPKRYASVKTPWYLQVHKETSGTQPTYSVFDVNDERIKVTSKQIDGAVLDEYSIEKNNLGQVEIDAGTDMVAVQGCLGTKSTIVVRVTYPDVQQVQSADDICFIDQLTTDAKGIYYFKFGDRQKTHGEYKISMNISGIVSQYNYGYQPNIYMLEGQKKIEQLSDISEASLTAKAEIINVENGRLFCAQYYDGVLKDVKFVDVSKGEGDGMTISYLGSSEVDEIKLFFWDNTSLTPSIEPVVIY